MNLHAHMHVLPDHCKDMKLQSPYSPSNHPLFFLRLLVCANINM